MGAYDQSTVINLDGEETFLRDYPSQWLQALALHPVILYTRK